MGYRIKYRNDFGNTRYITNDDSVPWISSAKVFTYEFEAREHRDKLVRANPLKFVPYVIEQVGTAKGEIIREKKSPIPPDVRKYPMVPKDCFNICCDPNTKVDYIVVARNGSAALYAAEQGTPTQRLKEAKRYLCPCSAQKWIDDLPAGLKNGYWAFHVEQLHRLNAEQNHNASTEATYTGYEKLRFKKTEVLTAQLDMHNRYARILPHWLKPSDEYSPSARERQAQFDREESWKPWKESPETVRKVEGTFERVDLRWTSDTRSKVVCYKSSNGRFQAAVDPFQIGADSRWPSGPEGQARIIKGLYDPAAMFVCFGRFSPKLKPATR